MAAKRFVLVAQYSSIEPLGILHLSGLVRDAGWDCKVVLIKGDDYAELYDTVQNWRPDIVGFQIWTGNHLAAFRACNTVRGLGVPLVIGGPHATYFFEECAKHADWVVQASGFGFLQDILGGVLPHGVHFSREGRSEPFPLPDRDLLYETYPGYGESPIKSMFASVGCPYKCTYCYAPVFNRMHNGFLLTNRPVDDLVQEAKAILRRWPLSLVYFQDDVFGFNPKWLGEFAQKWKTEVGVPFHAQMRLEMTQHAGGDKRLDLFREAGCSGITLAIESGNAFLRDHVLFRHMPDELILEGCRKIMDRGMTLRTEQILGVPFSNLETELQTLDLNARINPTLAWTSILSPYGGTAMGTISSNYGLYRGNNDDLLDNFFEASVLRHIDGGPRDIERMVAMVGATPKDETLLAFRTEQRSATEVSVFDAEGTLLGSVTHLTPKDNERYCRDLVRLQRLFNFLPKFPDAALLGRTLALMPQQEWTWEGIGRQIEQHLVSANVENLSSWKDAIAAEMGYGSVLELPGPIASNPWLFCVVPAGGHLARRALEVGVFDPLLSTEETLDRLGTLGRRHLFEYGLYQIQVGSSPICSR